MDSESDGEGQEIAPTNQTSTISSVTQPCAGTPIRDVVFPERDPDFNLYAPFADRIDYTLALFFNRAKVSRAAINEFLKDGILNDLNPTHKVQFSSAYQFYKLIDAVADEPSWYSGTVDYPLQKAVMFRYRNIISVVKYLLRQKVYAVDIVWEPRQEYDNERNRVYSEINTGIWWEHIQVS